MSRLQTRSEVLYEASLCIEALRRVVTGAEHGMARPTETVLQDLARLQKRIEMLVDNEQERRLRRFITGAHMRTLTRTAVLAALLLVLPALAAAQSIPPPSGPVTVCGTQAAPAATNYQVVFDGGAPQAVTMTTPAAAACPSASTHSFTLAASLFTVGTHTIKVLPTNQFGTNNSSTSATVTVGIAPGTFTPTAVIGALLKAAGFFLS